MILCELCNKNPATVHLTEILHQNVRKEIHLCDECAKNKGVTFKSPLSEILSGVLDAAGKGLKELAELKCPQCGITYAEFRSRTRLGCPNDYVVFQGGLLPLLEKIHGATHHRGKVPSNTAVQAARPPEPDPDQKRDAAIEALESELDRLVKAEEYEKAAQVRDQIRTLKEQAG
ncbi:MAG: UvrB/UvrC motif-containing protein [Planctomycetes bacterium]|nr:UvrB/UvrC motif-containing protein [Planctomycetota bacterium]